MLQNTNLIMPEFKQISFDVFHTNLIALSLTSKSKWDVVLHGWRCLQD